MRSCGWKKFESSFIFPILTLPTVYPLNKTLIPLAHYLLTWILSHQIKTEARLISLAILIYIKTTAKMSISAVV